MDQIKRNKRALKMLLWTFVALFALAGAVALYPTGTSAPEATPVAVPGPGSNAGGRMGAGPGGRPVRAAPVAPAPVVADPATTAAPVAPAPAVDPKAAEFADAINEVRAGCTKMAQEGYSADQIDALFVAMASDLDPVVKGLAKIACAQGFIAGGGQ